MLFCRVFSASLECSPSYGGKVECQVNFKNNGHRDFSVLKWHTPLEGLASNCLSVTRYGKKIPYDGIYMKRGTPGPDDFVMVAAGQTVSRKFDVFEGYDVSKAGLYSITVDTYLEYAVGILKSVNEPGKASILVKISHLSSPTVSLKVVGRKAGNRTPGQRARALERENKSGGNTKNKNVPLDPVVNGGTADQQKETKEVHRASYHYIKASIPDLHSSPDRAKTWFGTSSDVASKIFGTMEELLRSDTITYKFGSPQCRNEWYAFTYKGTRTIYFCKLYELAPVFSAHDTKISTVVHELTHAMAFTDDITYGYNSCKMLAKSDPTQAVNNADNYNYFVSTLFPLNYGFDAMTTLPDGYIYVIKGNMYVRYTDSSANTLDPAYPKLMQGFWGNLPDNFAQSFDSVLSIKGNGKTYATKGSQYIRYSDKSASTVDSGYPIDLSTEWGVSGDFSAGFDSMAQLSNGKTFVTKGPWYIRYSDENLSTIDDGYPKKIADEWGSLPKDFESGFDAMALLPDGKTYVSRGSKYIRYSDPSASQVDDGYPLPIKGNWGNVPQ